MGLHCRCRDNRTPKKQVEGVQVPGHKLAAEGPQHPSSPCKPYLGGASGHTAPWHPEGLGQPMGDPVQRHLSGPRIPCLPLPTPLTLPLPAPLTLAPTAGLGWGCPETPPS